jgi:hypothetical protein
MRRRSARGTLIDPEGPMAVGWLLVAGALAAAPGGYGDAVGGLPALEERELHLWTNAARVDPEAFEADYNRGGCSYDADFSEDEQTPKWPLMIENGLTEAAEFHSADMADNDWFSHDSSDGTSFFDRVARYYDSGNVGENIAMGYPSMYDAVFTGWMCSTDGHRANIMSGGYDELGVGVVGAYYTQDFGGRGLERPAIAMGAHMAGSAGTAFRADFFDADGAAPDELVVVLDGEAHALTLEYGEASSGIYVAELEVAEEGCHEYYFEAAVGGAKSRFPELGSYGWGDCEWDDAGAMWLARQLGADGGEGADERDLRDQFELVGGCDSSGGGILGFAPVLLLAVRRRR